MTINRGHTGLSGIMTKPCCYNCEAMKLRKIWGLIVKLNNDESKFSPIMTDSWEEKVVKLDKSEVKPSW